MRVQDLRAKDFSSPYHVSSSRRWHSYTGDKCGSELLRSYSYNKAEYKSCYGNQLQQVIHNECLDILGHVALPSTPLNIGQDIVVDCVDAA